MLGKRFAGWGRRGLAHAPGVTAVVCLAGVAWLAALEWTPPAFAEDAVVVRRTPTIIPPRPGDADGDGLPDEWERARTSWGLLPYVPNLIFVPVFRPNVLESAEHRTRATENIERVKRFFRALPVETRGPRGAIPVVGIEVIVRPGNLLSDFYREGVVNEIDYGPARSPGMPRELIGYAHGMLIGTDPRGGGHTSGPDWSGVGNHHATMIHELGHQLGLNHDPTPDTPSPLYTSLMNYNYNYGFDGQEDAIHFSRGKFGNLRLNERRLDETLPFPITGLSFLARAPYGYSLQSRSATSTSVDWNRNGIHGERAIRADVNDGTALTVQTAPNAGITTGDLALAAQGASLVVIRSTTIRGANRVAGRGANPTTPASLSYTVVRNQTVIKSAMFSPLQLATGAPSALRKGSRIIVAFPSVFDSLRVGAFTLRADGSLSGQSSSVRALGGTPVPTVDTQVTLVDTPDPNAVALVQWDARSRQVRVRRVTVFGTSVTIGAAQPVLIGSSATPLTSTSPPGGVLNTVTNRVMLVLGEGSRDRLRLWTLDSSTAGYRASGARWLGGEGVRSPDRPAIVFDSGSHTGPQGRYLVYYRAHGEGLGTLAQLRFARVTPGRNPPAGDAPFPTRDMVFTNIWTVSRNPPAATPYQGDYAVVWRVKDNDKDPRRRNESNLNYMCSGEWQEGPADFDDVGYLATTGLWSSITGLRR